MNYFFIVFLLQKASKKEQTKKTINIFIPFPYPGGILSDGHMKGNPLPVVFGNTTTAEKLFYIHRWSGNYNEKEYESKENDDNY